MANRKDSLGETTKYIACAVERKQKRDASGKFIKKEVRYIKSNCPKVNLCQNIYEAKLYPSHSRALYALGMVCQRQKNKYDFSVMKIKVKYER